MGREVLAIVGSVSFACPVGQWVAGEVIEDELRQRRPDAVASGGADGVDSIGEWFASRDGIEFLAFLPSVKRWHGPGGFKERNEQIAQACTRLLRVCCAESKTFGSGWTAKLAAGAGKPVRQVVVFRDGTVRDSGWPPGEYRGVRS